VPLYRDYFDEPIVDRLRMRRQLQEIPTELRHQPGSFLNYEGLQSPAAYLLMAAPERLLSRIPIPARVVILRFLFAAVSSLLLLAGAERLFRVLQIPDPYADAALFCMLSCQMLWATIAHVGNDWLAVTLSVWLLLALVSHRTASAAAILAAGLLTKAYFLACIPLLLILCALRRRWRDLAIAVLLIGIVAGPWYARNVARYGDLTGTIEARSVGLGKALQSVPSMPWPAVAGATFHSALWTGNNSLTAFSALTLNLFVAVLLACWALWAFGRHNAADWITLAYCGLFALVFAYSAIFAWLSTNGLVKSPQPWYWQVLAAPAFGIAMMGASRRHAIGRYLAAVLVLLSGYILTATYLVKLVPLYGGYEGRTTLTAVAALYTRDWTSLASNLDTVALAPARLIVALAVAVIALVVLLEISLLRRILFAPPPNSM
jgi:hypothetical protein